MQVHDAYAYVLTGPGFVKGLSRQQRREAAKTLYRQGKKQIKALARREQENARRWTEIHMTEALNNELAVTRELMRTTISES